MAYSGEGRGEFHSAPAAQSRGCSVCSRGSAACTVSSCIYSPSSTDILRRRSTPSAAAAAVAAAVSEAEETSRQAADW